MKGSKNKIVNIVVAFKFDYMPILPVIEKAFRLDAYNSGVHVKKYHIKITWLFIRIKPVWRFYSSRGVDQ